MTKSTTMALGLAVLTALVGCDDAAGPAGVTAPVTLSMKLAGGTPGASATLFAAGLEFSDGSNTLVIESAEMVLREIEFERQFDDACDGDLEDDACEKFVTAATLIALPLDGSVSQEIAADVEPGTYDEIEFEVHKLDALDPGSDVILASRPEFDDISILISGTFNGSNFVFTSDLNEDQEVVLTSVLVVEPGATAVNVTLEIDLGTWFAGPGGTLMDPATANKGQVNEDVVKDNIRTSIEGFRDDDHDGVAHDEDSDEDDS